MMGILRLFYLFNFCSSAVTDANLRMATVIASEELAHGQITSGRSPRDWNTLRKASQEDIDPAVTHTHKAIQISMQTNPNVQRLQGVLNGTCLCRCTHMG